ncbi:MAG TPA: NB-ARC domain-containing protein [Longimicrobium sp.]|nr:NB-ARC domain-containing protein [Longimicrobium sp.]
MPVSASHWKHSPLKDYQASWDPNQPLDCLDEHRRNAALVTITLGIAEAAEAYVAALAEAPRRERRTVPAIGSPRAKAGPGDLHGVPALPPHFVSRTDDLNHLRRSLLGGGSDAVGITGEQYRMGLHGLGGIGKSVLAAALARDEQVRLAFPDGVFWVTVGDAPDVPRLQSALLAEAGAESIAVTDAQRGRKLMEECFGGSAVLLVLDDVWDFRHARAFDTLGPASRLLVTTRDAAVLTALGAHPETLQCLPESAALDLLASWAGRDNVALPEAARGIARECGYLPLALSLAGARVRDRIPWEVVLTALGQGRLEFLDHPYGSVFGSMRLGVDALPPDERERYLELAVFPEDEQVPEPVVLTLWKQTAGLDELGGRDLLARLHGRALLEILETDGRRKVGLHDLQHDFLRISVRNMAALHGALLSALTAESPFADGGTEWWRLPPNADYAWVHLARHLVAADRGEELRGLLFDCRWLEAKLRVTGLPAVLADFAALPPDEELSLVAGALRLSGHVLGRDPAQLRSQLTGRLLAVDRPRIGDMLCGASIGGPGPWLRPIVPSLSPPTGALLRTLVGHTFDVNAVVVTPDGRRAVSASDDRTLKVWDLETGELERTLAGHRGSVGAVAVTPDGRRAISASGDRTLKVWDLETGEVERTLAGHTESVTAVALTPEGRHAVSASKNGWLKVWDLETGEEERTLSGHTDLVNSVAVTPEGRRAVSASWDGTLTVWNLETGAQERTLEALGERTEPTPQGGDPVVVVAPEGRRAISASFDGTLKVWNLETGEKERTLAGYTSSIAVVVTPEGRCAMITSPGSVLKVWDLTTGQEERTLVGHTDLVNSVAVTPEGRRAISASKDGTLKVWDLESPAEERTFAGRADRVTAVAVTPENRRAVSASWDRTLKVWDLKTGAEERTLAGKALVGDAVEVTPDGRRVVAISASNPFGLNLWNLETGEEECALDGHTSWVAAVGVTPDGRRAVSASHDGTLKVWNLETGREERTLVFYTYPVEKTVVMQGEGYGVCQDDPRISAVAVTLEGHRIVSGSNDGTLKVWHLETGKEEFTLAGHTRGIIAVAVTPDGRRAVSVSEDMLKVWNLETGEEERTLAGHERGVIAVALTPDGRRVISASWDDTLKVWNLETGEEEHTLAGHTHWVRAVAVTMDGRRAISASKDGTLKVWDLESGCTLVTFTADGPINCCAAAPSGDRLLAGDELGRIHFLSLEGLSPE